MKRNIVFFLILVLVISCAILVKRLYFTPHLLAIGTANPGKILLYDVGNNQQKLINQIKSPYAFVYTVRFGDIYNNGKTYLISGEGNSFYGNGLDCQVAGYDLQTYQRFVIDDLRDLRCKDVAIGDADNDGTNDIVLSTHGTGLVRFYHWNGSSWTKEDIDKNYIGQADTQKGGSHRVPNQMLPCKDCVVQTAVHIIAISDIDNDGKNEVLASTSSPLELQQGADEVTYLLMYKKVGNSWQRQVLTSASGGEFRGIAVGDLYNNGQKAIIIGMGSGRNKPSKVIALTHTNGQWVQKVVFTDNKSTNLKSIDLADLYHDGKQRLVISTGFPDSRTLVATWDGSQFEYEKVGALSQEMPMKDTQYNSMVVLVNRQSQMPQIFNTGFMTHPSKKLGAEASTEGFLAVYSKVHGQWQARVTPQESSWAMAFASN